MNWVRSSHIWFPLLRFYFWISVRVRNRKIPFVRTTSKNSVFTSFVTSCNNNIIYYFSTSFVKFYIRLYKFTSRIYNSIQQLHINTQRSYKPIQRSYINLYKHIDTVSDSPWVYKLSVQFIYTSQIISINYLSFLKWEFLTLGSTHPYFVEGSKNYSVSPRTSVSLPRFQRAQVCIFRTSNEGVMGLNASDN